MGFLSNVIRPKAISTTMETLLREHFGGSSTSSGVSVNSDSALRLIAVYNCVKVLYNCVSQMPCQLMEDINDVKNKATKHPLYKVIGKRPNGWMTASELWGKAIVDVSLRGNFVAFKTNVGPYVREILPINPDRLQEIKQHPDFSITYKISDPSGANVQEYPQSKIFHIRGMSLDGITGMNPIQYARECIGLGMAGEKFLARYFGKGLHPGAILTHPLTLNPITHANKLEAIRIKYAGLNNSQDVMLLDEAIKVDFPPIKLVDQQFLELMKMSEAQIAGMFGVPLILIQAGSTPATYASSVQFKQSFVDFTIAPIAVNFESSIGRDLLTESESDTLYAKFNMGSLLRGNMAERFGAYAIGITNRFMNPNQARALEDWNGYEGGDAYEKPEHIFNAEDTRRKGVMNPLSYRNEWNAMLISAKYKKPIDQPDWYKVEDVSDEEASILLYDYIGWPFNPALDFVKALSDMKQPKITIRINSPGGDVWDANAIFNAIKAHPSKPITRIESMAASAASYIAVAGSQKQAYKNSIIMIHEPRVYVGVNQYEMDETKELLIQVSDMLIDLYADNTNVGKREIKAMMKGDGKQDGTWMNVKTAKEKGFIDSIIEAGKPVTATEYFPIFDNLPDEFMSEDSEPAIRRYEKALRDVGASKSEAKAILARGLKQSANDDEAQRKEEIEAKELAELMAAARKFAAA